MHQSLWKCLNLPLVFWQIPRNFSFTSKKKKNNNNKPWKQTVLQQQPKKELGSSKAKPMVNILMQSGVWVFSVSPVESHLNNPVLSPPPPPNIMDFSGRMRYSLRTRRGRKIKRRVLPGDGTLRRDADRPPQWAGPPLWEWETQGRRRESRNKKVDRGRRKADESSSSDVSLKTLTVQVNQARVLFFFHCHRNHMATAQSFVVAKSRGRVQLGVQQRDFQAVGQKTKSNNNQPSQL